MGMGDQIMTCDEPAPVHEGDICFDSRRASLSLSFMSISTARGHPHPHSHSHPFKPPTHAMSTPGGGDHLSFMSVSGMPSPFLFAPILTARGVSSSPLFVTISTPEEIPHLPSHLRLFQRQIPSSPLICVLFHT